MTHSIYYIQVTPVAAGPVGNKGLLCPVAELPPGTSDHGRGELGRTIGCGYDMRSITNRVYDTGLVLLVIAVLLAAVAQW